MNKRKAALGGYYFFYFAAQACMAGSLNVYLESAAGLSGGELGAFHGLSCGAAALTLPLVGYGADRSGRRWLLGASLLALTLAAAGLGRQRAFLGVVLWGMAWEVARSASVALADQGASGRTGRGYGSVRSLGSLGYLAGGLALGALSGVWRLEKVLFPLYLALMLPAVGLAFLWPEGQKTARRGSRKECAGLFGQSWFWPAAVMGVLGSVGVSAVQPWLGTLLLGELGAEPSILGWNSLCCVVGEVVALPLLSRVLIPKWGHSRCFRLTAAALALRCVLYALAPNGWVALSGSLLYGLSVGAYTAVNLSFVASRVGEGSRATVVLTIAALSAVGRGLAGWGFGALYDSFGTRSIFWAMASAALAALFLPGAQRANSSSTGQ